MALSAYGISKYGYLYLTNLLTFLSSTSIFNRLSIWQGLTIYEADLLLSPPFIACYSSHLNDGHRGTRSSGHRL